MYIGGDGGPGARPDLGRIWVGSVPTDFWLLEWRLGA